MHYMHYSHKLQKHTFCTTMHSVPYTIALCTLLHVATLLQLHPSVAAAALGSCADTMVFCIQQFPRYHPLCTCRDVASSRNKGHPTNCFHSNSDFFSRPWPMANHPSTRLKSIEQFVGILSLLMFLPSSYQVYWLAVDGLQDKSLDVCLYDLKFIDIVFYTLTNNIMLSQHGVNRPRINMNI